MQRWENKAKEKHTPYDSPKEFKINFQASAADKEKGHLEKGAVEERNSDPEDWNNGKPDRKKAF